MGVYPPSVSEHLGAVPSGGYRAGRQSEAKRFQLSQSTGGPRYELAKPRTERAVELQSAAPRTTNHGRNHDGAADCGEVRCAWCDYEGRDGFIRWDPELPAGTVSHGICQAHLARELAKLEGEG